MTPCEITQDLLPLYIDNSCTEDSREYVEQHLAECAECRSIYETMNKSIQFIHTRQKAKKSFSDFQKRMMTRRTLLITLCAVLVLIALSVVAFEAVNRYMFYQYWPQPARLEPIVSTVSRLSDGSIYLTLYYADDDVCVSQYHTDLAHLSNPFTETDIYFEDNGTFYIQPGYMPAYQKDKELIALNRDVHDFILPTEESYPKYAHYSTTVDNFDQAYNRIVLIGSDGERVLWEAGNELPAADTAAEAELTKAIALIEYYNSPYAP